MPLPFSLSRVRSRRPRSPLEGVAPAATAAGARAGSDPPPGADLSVLEGGRASLADLLAPASLDASAEDTLRFDGQCARTLLLTGYPPTVALAWLDPLLRANETLDISLHLQPVATSAAQQALRATMNTLQTFRLADARHGLLEDKATALAYEHCDALSDRLQRGEEKALSACVYITLYAPTLPELEARTTRVEELIGGLLGQTRRCSWQAVAGLRATLPLALNALASRRAARTLDTSTVASMFPFSGATLQMPGGVLLGRDLESNQQVILDPFAERLFNYNQVVVGASGSGKSYTVKELTQRTAPLGVQTIIVDPTGEYAPLTQALGGQVVRLSAGAAYRINPLDLPRGQTAGPRAGDAAPHPQAGADVTSRDRWDRDEDDEDDEDDDGEPDPFKGHLATVHGFVDILLCGQSATRGQGLTLREKAALDSALRGLYGRWGITSDPATHERPAPLLDDLRDHLRGLGDPQGLADRLDLYCWEGAFGGLFSGPSTPLDQQARLLTFALPDLHDELWPAAMYLASAHIWKAAAADTAGGGLPRPRRVVVDEAQLLTAHASGGALITDVARRGRKRFIGLTAISQDVRDFLHTAPGQALLVNSAIRILLRQDDSTLEALGESLRLSPREQAFLASCGRGEALLVVQGTRLKIVMEASEREHGLCTTNPHDTAARPPRRPPAAA